MFSDLLIEIYQDPDPVGFVQSTPSGTTAAEKVPFSTFKSHKIVVSLHSKYLMKMLSSGMREGSENTIRLTTSYPQSLQKLLRSFYEHVLEIESAEELIEMLYLADEFDLPFVMTALKNMLEITALNYTAENANTFLLCSAQAFLTCSARLQLNLESKVFTGLARQWAQFGPLAGKEHDYQTHKRNCTLLLDSLNFLE
jgi:hypothetical protein